MEGEPCAADETHSNTAPSLFDSEDPSLGFLRGFEARMKQVYCTVVGGRVL